MRETFVWTTFLFFFLTLSLKKTPNSLMEIFGVRNDEGWKMGWFDPNPSL